MLIFSCSLSLSGTHVTLLQDQICRYIADSCNKLLKDGSITPAQVRSKVTVFVHAFVANPAFDTQVATLPLVSIQESLSCISCG